MFQNVAFVSRHFSNYWKAALQALGLERDDTITVDCGHCSGRFCFTSSAIGLESIGFGSLFSIFVCFPV